MIRAAALFALLLGCATAAPTRDTPMFRSCKTICAERKMEGAAVLETEDAFECYCGNGKKPAEPPKAVLELPDYGRPRG